MGHVGSHFHPRKPQRAFAYGQRGGELQLPAVGPAPVDVKSFTTTSQQDPRKEFTIIRSSHYIRCFPATQNSAREHT
jgi:hypothetical protein